MTEKGVALHLGQLKRGFYSGELTEEMIENAHESHFLFHMDNGGTISFRGDEEKNMQILYQEARSSQ